MDDFKLEFSGSGKQIATKPFESNVTSPASPSKQAELHVVLIEAMNTAREKNGKGEPMPSFIGVEVFASPLSGAPAHPKLVYLSSPAYDNLALPFRQGLIAALAGSWISHVAIVCALKSFQKTGGSQSPQKSRLGNDFPTVLLARDGSKELVRLATANEMAKVIQCIPAEYAFKIFKALGPEPLRFNTLFVSTVLKYGFFQIVLM